MLLKWGDYATDLQPLLEIMPLLARCLMTKTYYGSTTKISLDGQGHPGIG
jgi:hypothetical protein